MLSFVTQLKHGRVAMLATVGWAWTATGTHFEGMLSTSAGISFASLAQLDPLTAASKVPAAGIWQMIVAIGCLEVTALGRPNPPLSRTPNPPGAPPLAPSRNRRRSGCNLHLHAPPRLVRHECPVQP